MKKLILILFTLSWATIGFADHIVLNNQTKKSSIVIQWATSSKQVEENNIRIKQGKKLDPQSLKVLTRTQKINLDIPKNAEYFRVLAWSKKAAKPDLLTNWVDIIPNKVYTLTEDHFTPIALMSGTGC